RRHREGRERLRGGSGGGRRRLRHLTQGPREGGGLAKGQPNERPPDFGSAAFFVCPPGSDRVPQVTGVTLIVTTTLSFFLLFLYVYLSEHGRAAESQVAVPRKTSPVRRVSPRDRGVVIANPTISKSLENVSGTLGVGQRYSARNSISQISGCVNRR